MIFYLQQASQTSLLGLRIAPGSLLVALCSLPGIKLCLHLEVILLQLGLLLALLLRDLLLQTVPLLLVGEGGVVQLGLQLLQGTVDLQDGWVPPASHYQQSRTRFTLSSFSAKSLLTMALAPLTLPFRLAASVMIWSAEQSATLYAFPSFHIISYHIHITSPQLHHFIPQLSILSTHDEHKQIIIIKGVAEDKKIWTDYKLLCYFPLYLIVNISSTKPNSTPNPLGLSHT